VLLERWARGDFDGEGRALDSQAIQEQTHFVGAGAFRQQLNLILGWGEFLEAEVDLLVVQGDFGGEKSGIHFVCVD